MAAVQPLDSSRATRQYTTIDEALDQIGVGRFQRRLLLVNGLTWAADAMEVLILGFLIAPVTAEFKLAGGTAAYIGTATFAGMFLGAWLWGLVADRIGRRTVFLSTVLQTALFGTLAAFSPNFTLLLILRFLTGTALGGTLPVDYSIMAEFLPTRERGRFLVYLESFWALGTIGAALLAWAFVPNFTFGWRLLIGTSALVGLLGYWIRRSVPESPRYLLVNGRSDEAREVLRTVARVNGQSVEVHELRAEPQAAKPGFGSIWQAGLARKSLMLSLMWFGLSFGYYGIFTWLPPIFAKSGFTFIRTYAYPLQLLLALAQIPGYVLAAYLIDRWGRKPTLAAYLAGGAIFSFVFAVAGTPLIFILSSMLLSFMLLGAWGALYVFTPELFPTEVRATGMGWASAMARLAGMVAPPIGIWLLGISLAAGLAVYASFFILALVATILVGRDTRNVRLADRAIELAV